MYPTPMVIQTAAPRRSYRRRSYRPRYRRRRTKLSRGLRTFRNARRKYPASQFGYVFQPRTESTMAAFGNSYREATEAQKQDRQNSKYYGRGRYDLLKKAGKYAWKHRGAITRGAAALGIPGAAQLNALTGKGVYTGQGDYEGSNGLFSSETADVPIVSSSGTEDGEIKISHREYLTDLYGNAYNVDKQNQKAFDLQAYDINPGLEQTFPWLSQLAQNFEEYELEQCIFSFRSTVQEVSSENGQVGTITMATLYNVDNPNFRDKTEMMQYAHSNSVKSTDDVMHGVECDNDKLSGTDEKYIRSGPLDLGLQKKDYDHGRFQVAIANTPYAFSDASIGELWVSYTVTLRKPKIFSARGKGISEFMAVTDRENGQKAAVYNSSYLNPFVTDSYGDPFLYARKNSLNLKLECTNSSFKIIFPASVAGVFSVHVMLKAVVNGTSSSTLLNFAEPNLGGNITAVNDILDTTLDIKTETNGLGVQGTGKPYWTRKSYLRDEDWEDLEADKDSEWIRLEMHIRVAPVTGASDNVISWEAGDYIVKTANEGLSNAHYYMASGGIVHCQELPTSTMPTSMFDNEVEREWVNAIGVPTTRVPSLA